MITPSCFAFDQSDMNNKVQEAFFKTYKIDEMLDRKGKELQAKYIPEEMIRPLSYVNFANDILIRKQISFKWSF
jgi:hypothetical protein